MVSSASSLNVDYCDMESSDSYATYISTVLSSKCPQRNKLGNKLYFEILVGDIDLENQDALSEICIDYSVTTT